MSNLIQGRGGPWEVVIGLETHAHVIAAAKLFSGASTAFGAEPNTQVSTVDAAFPGMLPVINRHCVEQAVKTGLGLNAAINLVSVFDRKNYFYADLPAGYQISQFKQPIVGTGEIVLDLPDGATRRVGITRLHLEQDAGKSLHDQHPAMTYVDLNRAGVALMEIVSEPDLRSAEEAGAYVRKLRAILRYLGTCDGNMEEGSLRCDCNVSVRRPGAELGTRAEIKNVNSVRFVMQAIEYEARRQIALIEEGGTVMQETRLYDPNRGETRPMRSKENDYDYRYFPDPDLLPLELDAAWVESLKRDLPELPDAYRRWFINSGVSPAEADQLIAEPEIARAAKEAISKQLIIKFHDRVPAIQAFVQNPVSAQLPPTFATAIAATSGTTASTITNVVFAIANTRNEDRAVLIQKLYGAGFGEVQDGTVIPRAAIKEVGDEIAETGKSAMVIVAEKGLRQVTDTDEIEKAIDAVLAAQADKVADYRSGKDKLYGFFVGQVMKATGGKANPALLNELLKKKLAG
jgi:aspartyl-tRNA(Asn)/glutamyl-tRNA(Gln) amidotransferase subunit B